MGSGAGGIILNTASLGRLGRHDHLALVAAFPPVANPDPRAHPIPNPLHDLCCFGRDLEDEAGVAGDLELGGWIGHDPGVINRLLVDDRDVLGGTDDDAVRGNAGVADRDHRVSGPEIRAIGGFVAGDGMELLSIGVREVDIAARTTACQHERKAGDGESHPDLR